MKTTRITYQQLETKFEEYVDLAAAGETFVFEHKGKDFYLMAYEEPEPVHYFPNRLLGE